MEWQLGSRRHPIAFGCSMMFMYGLELSLWKPLIPIIRIRGAGYRNDNGEYPSQEVVNELIKGVFVHPSEENKKILHDWLKDAKTRNITLKTVPQYRTEVGLPKFDDRYL